MASVLPRQTLFSRPAPSHEEFIARLDSIEKIANSDNLLLNEDLGATKKKEFHWIVRVIMSPLYYLFCRDPFSDVKINRVAQKLEEYLRVNQPHFSTTSSSREVKAIADRIIARLNKRTHDRYHAILDRVLQQPNDQLTRFERADADAMQQAAWGTELNGLRRELEALRREAPARNQNPQKGESQGVRDQQTGLQTQLHRLRRELEAPVRNQNPQNGDLQEVREQQTGLQTQLHRLEENIEKLKGEAEVRNQNPQNGDLQGLQEQQARFQRELDNLLEGPEGLKKTQERLHNLIDIVYDMRESLKKIETKIDSELFNEEKGKASILFGEDSLQFVH